jgi:hypothetical protein
MKPIKGAKVRKLLVAIAAVSLTMALGGVASASAAQWSPQNTNAQMTNSGNYIMSGPGVTFTCTSSLYSGKTAGSSFAATQPPHFYGCNGGFLGAALVSTAGTWSINATSATTASLTADTSPSGGTVLTISFSGTSCAVKGPIKVTGLPWSNATHTLTLPSGTALPNMSTAGLCGVVFNGSLGLSGKFVAPGLTILP